MTFASKLRGMALSALSALVWTAAGPGCVVTDKIEFELEAAFPPSVVSQSNAENPLNQIARVNLDDPLRVSDDAFNMQVVVRDPNFDETLQYRIFIDAPPPPAPQPVFDEGSIEPSGFLERPRDFAVPFENLAPGACHKIELVVVGAFDGIREPEVPGDFDNVTWWVEITDDLNPVIEGVCQ